MGEHSVSARIGKKSLNFALKSKNLEYYSTFFKNLGNWLCSSFSSKYSTLQLDFPTKAENCQNYVENLPSYRVPSSNRSSRQPSGWGPPGCCKDNAHHATNLLVSPSRGQTGCLLWVKKYSVYLNSLQGHKGDFQPQLPCPQMLGLWLHDDVSSFSFVSWLALRLL